MLVACVLMPAGQPPCPSELLKSAWYGSVIYDLGIRNDFYLYPFVQPFPFSEAIDVNDSNRIAGNSFTINSHYRGFVLDALIP